MIKGIGTDITEIERIRKIIESPGDKFVKWVFTDREITYCEKKKNRAESYAARFAVKEAFSKAAGTGIGRNINFKDVETINDENGKPGIVLHGKISEKYKNSSIHVSISHSKDTALAFVIIE